MSVLKASSLLVACSVSQQSLKIDKLPWVGNANPPDSGVELLVLNKQLMKAGDFAICHVGIYIYTYICDSSTVAASDANLCEQS